MMAQTQRPLLFLNVVPAGRVIPPDQDGPVECISAYTHRAIALFSPQFVVLQTNQAHSSWQQSALLRLCPYSLHPLEQACLAFGFIRRQYKRSSTSIDNQTYQPTINLFRSSRSFARPKP